MWIRFKDSNDEERGLDVTFSNPPTYDIGYCEDNVTFVMPQGGVLVWTLTKHPTTLILSCNREDIFNYKFSDVHNSDCQNKWSTEVTAFQFPTSDTASDSYRALPNYGN